MSKGILVLRKLHRLRKFRKLCKRKPRSSWASSICSREQRRVFKKREEAIDRVVERQVKVIKL